MNPHDEEKLIDKLIAVISILCALGIGFYTYGDKRYNDGREEGERIGKQSMEPAHPAALSRATKCTSFSIVDGAKRCNSGRRV